MQQWRQGRADEHHHHHDYADYDPLVERRAGAFATAGTRGSDWWWRA
jgi:hypothetical protein